MAPFSNPHRLENTVMLLKTCFYEYSVGNISTKQSDTLLLYNIDIDGYIKFYYLINMTYWNSSFGPISGFEDIIEKYCTFIVNASE